jgi:hypothetical protein
LFAEKKFFCIFAEKSSKMIQQIIVYIIGIAVAACIGREVYLFFCSKKKRTDRCAGCPGCALNPKGNSADVRS